MTLRTAATVVSHSAPHRARRSHLAPKIGDHLPWIREPALGAGLICGPHRAVLQPIIPSAVRTRTGHTPEPIPPALNLPPWGSRLRYACP